MSNTKQNVEIRKAEYFDDRVYRISMGQGNYADIVSTTTYLSMEAKPFLYKWYGDLGWEKARKKLKESGDRGSRIHYAFYVYNNGGVVLFNPYNKPNYNKQEIEEKEKAHNGLMVILENQDEMVALWKLQRMMEILNPKIIQSEHTVFSLQKDIAGTLDLAIEVQEGEYAISGAKPLKLAGGLYISDLKTGNMVADSTWAQLAAYTEAYEDMYQAEVKGALCFHTSASTRKGIPGFNAIMKPRVELKGHFEFYKHMAAAWKFRNPHFSKTAFMFPTEITRGTK